jgi:hypothetical protein
VKCCIRPPEYGGSGIHVENEYFPFQWDKEKVDFNIIEKPAEDDLMRCHGSS